MNLGDVAKSLMSYVYEKATSPFLCGYAVFNVIIRKLFMRIILILCMFLSIAQSNALEYESQSIYSKNYKCESDEVGGYNHSNESHILTRFKSDMVFYLEHISSIPVSAVRGIAKNIYFLSDNTVDSYRETIESKLMTVSDNEFYRQENNSYFIFTPRDNYKNYAVYPIYNSSRQCKTTEMKNDPRAFIIQCYSDDKYFIFDSRNRRFEYSYMGTWAGQHPDSQLSIDSSVFAFGKCQEHYR